MYLSWYVGKSKKLCSSEQRTEAMTCDFAEVYCNDACSLSVLYYNEQG